MQQTADKVRALQTVIPTNTDNFPTAYIAADAIMSEFPNTSMDELEELVHRNQLPTCAITPLSYQEGYATTPDGLPFWERLDGEKLQYFELFKAYRDMIYGSVVGTPGGTGGNGNRLDITDPRSITSLRSMYIVAHRTSIARPVIKAISHLYHWPHRVRAFDQYRRLQLNRMRELEIEGMQNKHATAARRVFDKCLDFLEEHIEELNPKTALEWFRTSVELERLSLGLDPGRPDQGVGVGAAGNKPWVQINQQINQAAPGNGVDQGAGNGNQSREQRISEILSILQDAQALPAPDAEARSDANANVIDAEVLP